MYESRIYKKNEVIVFRKTKEKYGGLSNMASGFILNVNNKVIWNTESLYQSIKFTNNPNIQSKIIANKNPMEAKRIAYENIDKCREDWEQIKVKVMRWCLRVKLAQNFLKFGLLLEITHPSAIVEFSMKDDFWGAKVNGDKNFLVGINALGRLLMELREDYMSLNRYGLLIVEPLKIVDFTLLTKNIKIIDERNTFINNYIANNYSLWG